MPSQSQAGGTTRLGVAPSQEEPRLSVGRMALQPGPNVRVDAGQTKRARGGGGDGGGGADAVPGPGTGVFRRPHEAEGEEKGVDDGGALDQPAVQEPDES